MIASDPGAILRCPLCDVPHEPSAERCDACGQTMGADVDVAAIRAELVQRRRDIVFASVAIVGMVVANFALLPGAAIVALAPIGWLVRSVPRYGVLRRFLARRDAAAPRGLAAAHGFFAAPTDGAAARGSGWTFASTFSRSA